jgi:hypothetical protein
LTIDAITFIASISANEAILPICLSSKSTTAPSRSQTEITPYLATMAVGTQRDVFGGPLAVSAEVVAALQAAVG